MPTARWRMMHRRFPAIVIDNGISGDNEVHCTCKLSLSGGHVKDAIANLNHMTHSAIACLGRLKASGGHLAKLLSIALVDGRGWPSRVGVGDIFGSDLEDG